MMKNKYLIAVLLFCVAFASFSLKAFATEDYFTYEIEDGNAIITDVNQSICGAITIPSSFESYPVTSIGSFAFEYCRNITSITIPDSVTSIGSFAFQYCSNLTSITIPDSVTTIEYGLFEGCNNLADITFSKNIAHMNDNSIFDIPWYTNCKDEFIYIGKVLVGCRSEKKKIQIKDGVTQIFDNAFLDCKNLEEITLPTTLNYIGNDAFLGCINLKRVNISDLNAWLDIEMPYGYSLSSSNKAVGPLYYGADLYLNNQIVEELKIPQGKEIIKDCIFEGCNSIKKVVLPEGLIEIGSYAFFGCKNLKEINIPVSLARIGQYAFAYTSEVKVNINDLDAWLEISFAGGPIDGFPCSSNPLGKLYLNNQLIEDIVIPVTIDSIGDYQFEGCNSIRSVFIPKSIKNIGYGVFSDCNNLKKIYFEGTKEEWKQIRIRDYNQKMQEVEIIFNSKVPVKFVNSDFAKVNGDMLVMIPGNTTKQILTQAGSGAVIKDSKGNVLSADALLGTGMTLTLADGKSYAIVVFGDVEGDGKITAADARLALRASVNLENYKEDSLQYRAANINSADKLSAADARLILRASVGLEKPAEWMK